jgi:uncharacterized protein involved in outer membrane biogenesis
MKLFRRWLKWTVLTLLAAVLVMAVLVFTLDLGFLRETVEKRVSQAVQREFTIDGELSVRLGRDLVVRANDLRLANAPWAAEPDLARIDYMLAVIDPWSAWRGPLLIKRLEIDGTAVSLQQDETGRANWELLPAADPADATPAAVPFLLNSAQLNGADITFSSPRLERPLPIRIDRFEQRLQEDGGLQADASGELNGRPMHILATGGPYERLATGDNIHVEAEASFGAMRVTGSADLDNAWAPLRPAVELQVRGPDSAELAEIFGITGLGSGDMAFHASIVPADGEVEVRLTGNLGEFEMDATGAMPSLAEALHASIAARVRGPDFGRIARLAGKPGWPEEAFTLVTRIRQTGEGLLVEAFDLQIGETRALVSGQLPEFPSLGGSDLKLEISGPDLASFSPALDLEGLPRGTFRIKGNAGTDADGITRVDLAYELPMATGTVAGTLAGGPDTEGLDIVLTGKGSDAAQLGRLLGVAGLATEPWSLVLPVARGDADHYQLGATVFTSNSLSVAIQGRVGAESIDVGSDIRFSVNGERLADFQALAGDVIALPGEPFAFGGHVAADRDGWRLDAVSGHAGSTEFELDGLLGTGQGLAGTDLQWSVRGERLADFQALAGDAITLPGEPFAIGGRIAQAPDGWRLKGVSGQAGSTQFELDGQLGGGEGLMGTDLTLAARGTDIGRVFDLPGQARMPEGPFDGSGKVALRDGRVRIDNLELKAGPFELRLAVNAPWPPDLSSGNLALEMRGVNITRVLPELAGLTLDQDAYEVQAEGRWQDGTFTIGKGLARVGETRLAAEGVLDLPPNLSATDLRFSLQSPDISQLGTIDGRRWGTVPFELHTTFKGSATRFQMEQLRARLGESDIKGAFSMDFEPEVPDFDLRLSTTMLNLRPFLEDEPETAEEKPKPEKGARIIPDTAFPMDALARVNGRFAIAADRLLLRRVTLRNNAIIGEIADGRLQFNELAIGGDGGRLIASLALQPGPQGKPELTAEVHSTDLVIDFTENSEEEKKLLPAFDIDIDMAGSGATVREAAASLQGNIWISSPGGTVRHVGRGTARNPLLAEIVAAISPSAARQDSIVISCIAAAASARDGMLLLDPGLAIQSDKLNIFVSGRANLGNEKLDINLRTKTRKAADISISEVFSPYVKLAGTLAHPSVTIDPKGTLLSGGAAYLSGGLSILAKKALDQLGGTRDPCADLLSQAEAQNDGQ